jgi:cell division inhibitor SepF
MAGAMRKVGVYLGLVEDDEGYDGEYDGGYEPAYDAPVEYDAREHGAPRAIRVARPAERAEPASPRAGVATGSAMDSLRITTLHPRTYNEARVIGEQFRDGSPVIMNLSDMDDSDAKRLVDFAAGLVFGRHGSIEKVTQKVFLLTPANVEITAEDKSRMAGAGFFNQS